MDALKIIPQLFFDLIARSIPGVVALFLATVVAGPHLTWHDLLNQFAGGKLDPKNVFAFAVFGPLGIGFIVGHLIGPFGKLIEDIFAERPRDDIWLDYDYLRVHHYDSGALAAKIRAEYTMHFSLAVVFALSSAGILVQACRPTHPSIWFAGLFALLAASSTRRGASTKRTFANSVTNLVAAAKQEPGTGA